MYVGKHIVNNNLLITIKNRKIVLHRLERLQFILCECRTFNMRDQDLIAV